MLQAFSHFQALNFMQVPGLQTSEPRLQPTPALAGRTPGAAPEKAPRPTFPLLAMAAAAAVLRAAHVQRRALGAPQTASGVRVRKPMNNSLRDCAVATFEECTNTRRYEPLVYLYKRRLGQPKGRPIKMRGGTRREGGNKYRNHQPKRYRAIDFRRSKRYVFGTITSIEYDPYRTARISLVEYEDGEKRYILYAAGFFVGQQVIASEDAPIFVGNALPIDKVPPGTMVHNIQFYSGRRAAAARGAGTSAVVLSRDEKYVTVKMPSGEVRLIRNYCWCTIGKVGFAEHQLLKIGKAGAKRALGFKPHVRGKAKNAVDHPHGGGEGRSPIGHKFRMHPNYKNVHAATRRLNKYSDKFILIKRKKPSGKM